MGRAAVDRRSLGGVPVATARKRSLRVRRGWLRARTTPASRASTSRASTRTAPPRPNRGSAPLSAGRLHPGEAVAQTIAGLDFLCVCDKVRIRGRAFSAVEDPLWPPEPLSRGQQKQPLSNSYKGFGLCDGLRRKEQRAGLCGLPTPQRPYAWKAVSHASLPPFRLRQVERGRIGHPATLASRPRVLG